MKCRRIMVATAILASSVCVAALAQEKKAQPSMWSQADAAQARAFIDSLMDDILNMNTAAVTARMTEDVKGYDLDINGNPVRMANRAEATKYFETLFADAKNLGAKISLEHRTSECKATSTLGLCTSEFEFVATLPDSSVMSQPSVATMVVRKGDDGWKLQSWHLSLTVPCPPAAAGHEGHQH